MFVRTDFKNAKLNLTVIHNFKHYFPFFEKMEKNNKFDQKNYVKRECLLKNLKNVSLWDS